METHVGKHTQIMQFHRELCIWKMTATDHQQENYDTTANNKHKQRDIPINYLPNQSNKYK